jgi:hypothetical protein
VRSLALLLREFKLTFFADQSQAAASRVFSPYGEIFVT